MIHASDSTSQTGWSGQAPQQVLFAANPVASPDAEADAVDGVVKRRTDSLKPHPSLARRNFLPRIERLREIERLPDATFIEPLLITSEGLIIDGHARWLSAQHLRVTELPCIVIELTVQEALQRILQTHHRTQWLNAFCRIQLALDLEPWFREQARANQSFGGQRKASSKLTEDGRLDCRRRIAAVAGVSTGNVTKVKQLLSPACATQLMQALACGEVSIHAAWKLRNLSISDQKYELRNGLYKKRRQRRLRQLAARLPSRTDADSSKVRDFIACLRGLRTISGMDSVWTQIDDLISALEEKFPSAGTA